MPPGFVAIVDPYSSGLLLIQEFKRRGFECVTVQSTDHIPDLYRSSARADDSIPVIAHNGHLNETLARLSPYRVECVIPGCDLGVSLADELSQGLGLASNAPQLNQARVDKYLTTEAVRAHGLRVPAQIQSSSLAQVLEWVRMQNSFPLVVKPLNSTSSDGVFVCFSGQEISTAFDRLIRSRNALGLTNTAVLVQEFLDGTEYVVDTVSFAGSHRAAAFWKYRKSNLANILPGPECIELLPYEGEIQQSLFTYAKQVLDALGIRYGAAHIELMWSNGVPILVELGARVNGGNNPLICLKCTGSSQIQLLADAYLKGDHFLANLDNHYALHKKGIRAFLIPRCQGEYQNSGALREIESLASFQEIHVGSRKSWDAPRRIGWVILAHEDAGIVERDLSRIRELEQTEIYTH